MGNPSAYLVKKKYETEVVKLKRSVFVIFFLVLALLAFVGCSNQEQVESQESELDSSLKLEKLNIGAAPGPVSYGLAYIQENDMLNHVAVK